MTNTFDRANEALRHDLEAYAQALSSILTTLPRARALCEQVLKETRLAQALLAFASGPQTAELSQLMFHLSNLWPYRERAYARTAGFDEEIAEAARLREDALRGLRLLARHSDPLSAEVSLCLKHIARYLEEQQEMLETCHARIQPHATQMDLTRKRLNLLSAAMDARLPPSPQKDQSLAAYQATTLLLHDWENGVPLDERGIEVLDRCLENLGQADETIFMHMANGHGQDMILR